MKVPVKKKAALWLGLILLCMLCCGCSSSGPESAYPPASTVQATVSHFDSPTPAIVSPSDTPQQETVSPAETPLQETASPQSTSPAEVLPENSPAETISPAANGIRILLDEQLWEGPAKLPDTSSDLFVCIARGGELLIALPFEETHLITIEQPDGAWNTIMMTGSLVRMMDANCDNHDCVDMGEVTRENMEERVLGGFIICLPHQLSVEVRGR